MASYHSVLDPFVPPLANEIRVVPMAEGKPVSVKVRTVKLVDSAHYLFGAYVLDNDRDPILELISNPSYAELADAVVRYRVRQAKVATTTKEKV